ncbi:MAG: hypothetical protein AAGF31_13195 [Planctomycetota bacterium]
MAKPRNRQRNQLLITAGVMGLLVLVGGAVVFSSLPDSAVPPASTSEPVAAEATQPASPPEAPAEPAPSGPTLVEDDGQTLWASPTTGEPLSLRYLPPGCQFILSVRLADMLTTDDGQIVAEQFANLLRPLAADLAAADRQLRDVEQLTIGIRQGDAYGELDLTFVVHTSVTARAADTQTDPVPIATGKLGKLARFNGDLLVLAQPATLDGLAGAGGEPPPLRRELEQLASHTDADRHVSLLVAPSFLFAEGKSIFAPRVSALREPLFEQLPDALRGLLVSVHFGDDGFYWECRAAAAVEMTATQVATRFNQQLDRWAGELQLTLLDLRPAPYGRRVVANLPAMVRLAAQYARRGVVDRHAVLNGYLPPAAGHNLLLAAELMLAQQSAGGVSNGADGGPSSVAKASPQTAAERLAEPATVSFARDTLEQAVQYLSDEINVPIVILGGDLQLEGITKNQSFGLDERNRPGEAVLVEILRRANPDMSATGPADPRQKLVYVVRPTDGGADTFRETIFVTTRAAAAKRSEPLPSIFQSE